MEAVQPIVTGDKEKGAGTSKLQWNDGGQSLGQRSRSATILNKRNERNFDFEKVFPRFV